MPLSKKIPSIIRPVIETGWIVDSFLPELLAFKTKPENRDLGVDLRNMGTAGIRLMSRREMPTTVRPARLNGLLPQLLDGIDEESYRIRTIGSHTWLANRTLELCVMLTFDPALRTELKTIRQNVANAAGLATRLPIPVAAYGISLARFDARSITPGQRQDLLDLTNAVRPDTVTIGPILPLYGRD